MEPADGRLDRILDALDTLRPEVGYRVKAFPEGKRYAVLRHPGGGRAIVFAHERQWVCLSESASGTTSHSVLGEVGEAPEAIAGRLPPISPEPSGRRWPSTLAAVVLGVICAAGAAILTASLLILLTRGQRFAEDAGLHRLVILGLAAVAGLAAGGWAARVVWPSRRGRA
ncbi:hypothetical protein ACIBH1_23885 [Nonomuraea sp. NPDC050663]|uniref:hypothetical protein n=1 Tax=Nonomuraea sp. NPDC050663 TaxID=3364370 RepID=UPI0037969F87